MGKGKRTHRFIENRYYISGFGTNVTEYASYDSLFIFFLSTLTEIGADVASDLNKK